MTFLDRFLGHDAWTTRQLLLRCRELSDEQLDQHFDIGDRSVRETFGHLITCMEHHTEFIHGGSLECIKSTSIDGMLGRLTFIAKALSNVALWVEREGRADELITNPVNGNQRTIGSVIVHVVTHGMHHRAQILYMFEQLGLKDVIEGDALSWETVARGWGWDDAQSYGRPVAE